MLSVTLLSKKTKLSRKTVYKAFHGTASIKSVEKIQKYIYQLTGQLVPIKEITKGRYSDNSLIKSLCKNTEKSKKVSLINKSDFESCDSFCYDGFACCCCDCDTDLSDSCYDSGDHYTILL